ncbi:MAG: transporter [Deltaproteobacteria bacterium]|nr:transporter [Deltaproteobacteria bacterium]
MLPIWLLCCMGISAQGQELITDRPDFTESGVVVPTGSLQIEAGVTFEDGGDGDETISSPELLLRWGFVERLELRIGVPDWVDQRRGTSGISDGSLGVKWQLGPTSAGWDLGLIGTVSLPLGDQRNTSDEVDPDLIVTAGRDLSELWSLGGQVGVGRETAGADHETVLSATLVLGRALGERGGLFLEFAAEDREEGGTAVLFHHGFTYLVTPTFQWDVHAGVGLTDDAPDFLIGLGFSWRP